MHLQHCQQLFAVGIERTSGVSPDNGLNSQGQMFSMCLSIVGGQNCWKWSNWTTSSLQWLVNIPHLARINNFKSHILHLSCKNSSPWTGHKRRRFTLTSITTHCMCLAFHTTKKHMQSIREISCQFSNKCYTIETNEKPSRNIRFSFCRECNIVTSYPKQ